MADADLGLGRGKSVMRRIGRSRFLIFLGLIGPGLISAASDNDAGGVTSDGTAVWTDQGFPPVSPLLGGMRQTLGGVVYHARVKGRILANEGLQNSQGALVFPISILSGM